MAKRKFNWNLIITILLIIAIALGIFNIYNLKNVELRKEVSKIFLWELKENPLSLDGMEKVSVSVNSPSFSLTANCRKLTMTTTELQAYTIQTGLDKKVEYRPMTHDLIGDILKETESKVESVKINRVDAGDVYLADLIIKKDGKYLIFDARPSDAVGIAVRMDAPIYVSSKILDKYGEKVC